MKRMVSTFIFLIFCLSALCVSACKDDESNYEESNYIEFKTIEFVDSKATISVSNDTTEYSFVDEIILHGNVDYIVSLDKYGLETSMTKSAPLEEGDNELCVFETIDGEIVNSYEITIRRRPIYTVSFTGVSISVPEQKVEEDGFAVAPDITATKNGYSFDGWDFDFSKPISEDTKISAKWLPNIRIITLIYDNGDLNKNIEVPYDSKVEINEIPKKDGYVFMGWEGFLPQRMPDYDIELTAKWKVAINVTGETVIGFVQEVSGMSELVIPSQLEGRRIKKIGAYAFQSEINIKKLIIRDGVEKIEEAAFRNCSGLISVTLPDTLINIESWAFAACESLRFNVKDGLKYLGSQINPYLFLFGSVSLNITHAKIDQNCKIIGNHAFYGCTALEEVEIPNGVTRIGEASFALCSSLTTIKIPDSILSFAGSAFTGCDSLVFTIDNGLKYLGNNSNPYLYLVGPEDNSTKSAIINENCKIIAESSFSNCKSLETVSIGSGVKVISESSFSQCTSLKSVTIGSGVNVIGNHAFYGCSSLSTIQISNGVTDIESLAFFNCNALTSIIIPSNVLNMGEHVFNTWNTLTIYCEAKTKPDGWSDNWASGPIIVWGNEN